MTFSEISYLIIIVFELLFLIVLAVYVVSITASWLYGAPYVATRTDELKRLLAQAKQYLLKDTIFIELGCGDGRVARMATKRYGVIALGYDINPILIYFARLISHFQRLPKAQFYIKHVAEVDLSKAKVIYIFLLPPLVLKIQDKVQDAIEAGALIISHGFKIPFLKQYLVDHIAGVAFKTYYYKKLK